DENYGVLTARQVWAGVVSSAAWHGGQIVYAKRLLPPREKLVRKLILSGSPYEARVGISRAVRVGSFVTVSGTAALGLDGKSVSTGDAAAQARRCLQIIEQALENAGSSLKHVVRTRTLLTCIDDWKAVAAVHGEIFR